MSKGDVRGVSCVMPSLHHKVRLTSSKICDMEKEFKLLLGENLSPSLDDLKEDCGDRGGSQGECNYPRLANLKFNLSPLKKYFRA